MNSATKRSPIRAIAVGALVTACLLSTYRETATGGIQGSGIRRTVAVGRITGFGSIFVNGVEYSTAHAQMTIDGAPGVEAQLRTGDVVMLDGTLNDDGTGEAAQVSFFHDVRGPIARVNVLDQTMEVLGQTVHVRDDTLLGAGIDDLQVATLLAGLAVEVSGFVDSKGDLMATRVDLLPQTADFQVKGTAKALDRSNRSFRINALTVSYASIAPEGLLADGSIVEVSGSEQSASGALVANRIHVVDPGPHANQHGSIQGIITEFASDADFAMGAQRVITGSDTRFDLHGQRLGVNVEVNVKGTFDASGALVASKVSIKPHPKAKLSGLVEAINGETLTVGGRAVVVTPLTLYSDRSQLRLSTFTLRDLAAGDNIKVSGAIVGGVLNASSIERKDTPPVGPKKPNGPAKK